MTPTTTPMAPWLESAWLARYLDRQLSGEEAVWFEAYLLDKPELLGMVEGDNELRDGLAAQAMVLQLESSVVRRSDAGGDANEPAVADNPEASTPKRISKQSDSPNVTRRLAIPMALAASLVLGLGLGWIGERASVQGGGGPAVIASPTRIVFDTMRGATTAPRIENAASNSAYVLIEVAVPDQAQDAALIVDDVTVSLHPAPDGFASALIPRSVVDRVHGAVLRYRLNGNIQQFTLALTTEETAHE